MSDLVALAERAARAAGDLLVARFGGPARGVTTKTTGTDMVSDADRDAERLIVDTIAAARPDDAIFAEESGQRPGRSGLTWVIDPLDGTTNFLYGIPQWCVSVACEDPDGTVVGVVHDPIRDETFTAERDAGATLDGEPIRSSDLDDVSRALVATGFGYERVERERWGAVIASLLPRVRDVRRAGSAALDIAWCAAGRVDAYAEIPCARWDRAAGELIAAEAGCRATVLPAVGPAGDGLLAAPPALHDPLLAMIRETLPSA